ncbi:MAG: hypothetical protein KJO31_03905 [Gammaproteobacteria bacterium]|nr:hypothetical protein [Gammaproteobacteria bacterium]
MRFRDAYDLEVSCENDAAMQAFVRGIDASLRLDTPAIEEFEEAVSQDPEFALARVALGRQKLIHGDRKAARGEYKKALALKERVTPRESAAIDITIEGANVIPQTFAHVAEYPRDVFVLAQLLSPFGTLAFAGIPDWREQNAALLEETKPAYPEHDWWHTSTRAFVSAENGMLEQALQDGDLAWSISENGNCAHSLAHVHFEAGLLDEGSDFIHSWAEKYADESDMRHHLRWHLCLLDIDKGQDIGGQLSVYDRYLAPGIHDAVPLETLADNASLLWRLRLADVEIPQETVDELLDFTEARFPGCGFAFADLHCAMTAAVHPDKDKLASQLSALAEHAEQSRLPVANFVHQCAKSFAAFAAEQYADVVAILEPVLDDNPLIGGSNPQRRIVEETYLEASLRCGQNDKALAILDKRNRSSSSFDKAQRKRAGQVA